MRFQIQANSAFQNAVSMLAHLRAAPQEKPDARISTAPIRVKAKFDPLFPWTARHLGTIPGQVVEGNLYRAIGRQDTAVRVVAGGRNTDVEFSPGLDTTSFLVDPGGAVVPPLVTQILWINLITDTRPALAMGVDPIAEGIMARKPRPCGQRIIDARMWLGVLEGGVVMAVLTLLTLDLFLPGELIEPVDTWLGPGPHSLEGRASPPSRCWC